MPPLSPAFLRAWSQCPARALYNRDAPRPHGVAARFAWRRGVTDAIAALERTGAAAWELPRVVRYDRQISAEHVLMRAVSGAQQWLRRVYGDALTVADDDAGRWLAAGDTAIIPGGDVWDALALARRSDCMDVQSFEPLTHVAQRWERADLELLRPILDDARHGHDDLTPGMVTPVPGDHCRRCGNEKCNFNEKEK